MKRHASEGLKPTSRRRLFNLSWLAVLAPMVFLYQQMNPQPVVGEDKQLLRETLGPFRVVLIKEYAEDTEQGPDGRLIKYYELQCHGCEDHVKAAFLSAVPTGRDAATPCTGGPSIFNCQLAFPKTTSEPNVARLSLETWKGELWHLNIP